MHTSDFFLAHLQEWEECGLYVRRMGAILPELNIIEILWRKIKYEWMPFSAYQSFSDLKENLFDILKGIGSDYRIDFAAA